MSELLIQNIRRLMKKRGLAAKQVSVQAGLGETAMRDLLSGRTKGPRTSTLEKIAKVLECEVRDFFSPPYEQAARAIIPLPIIGEVEAGVWKSAVEWPRADWIYEPVPADPRFAGYSRFGLKVRGPSMNRLYREGDIVVCVPMIELQYRREPGRRYVVYRTNDRGEIEATLKEYFVDEDGKEWLVPRSDDLRFQMPIELNAPGTENIEIFARVTGSWRREE